MMLAPWMLHDAELALWPAGMDGHYLRGPGGLRDQPFPLFSCKSSLNITESFDASAVTGHDWKGSPTPFQSSYQIRCDFTDGALADSFGRVLSAMHSGGQRILTVRFLDEATGHWTLLVFYYVAPESDGTADSGEVMRRSVSLRSSWVQEHVGLADMPAMIPVLHGEVDWICGSRRVTAMRYDPITETWLSLPANDVGNGTRYLNLSPETSDEGADIILSAYLPRVVPAAIVAEELPTASILWQNTLLARIGSHLSAAHHGLTLQLGHTVQASGITEPLLTYPQARMIDEPVLVFRYLRRIYATLGHGVLAVPRLLENQPPPVVHDPAFRIAVPGPANPETSQAGLVILPNGAWLDGTVQTTP